MIIGCIPTLCINNELSLVKPKHIVFMHKQHIDAHILNIHVSSLFYVIEVPLQAVEMIIF